MASSAKIRQMFSLNANDKNFSNLNDKEKILVETGIEVVKKYFVNNGRKTHEVKDFADLLGADVKTDDYAELNRKFVSKLVKYCFESTGKDISKFVDADGNFDTRMIANPNNRDTAFKERFNAVIAQVITPVVPAMVSAFYMDLADISHIGWGDTARFLVKNNDIFYVTRIAEGVLEGSIQRVYNDELTVNPEPYNIKTAVDWYHVAAGIFDFGEFTWRIGVSFANYISLMIAQGLGANITTQLNQANHPYIVSGYSDTGFATLTELVRAANGNSHVTAYGTLTALMAVLPDVARVNMYADIGAEWTRVGHLTTYMDTHMVRLPQVMLPNTVNTNALLGLPGDTIYILPDGMYRPVKLVFEGDTFTLDIIPTETPDKLMGLSVTMRMGQGFAMGSKIGVMNNVVLK